MPIAVIFPGLVSDGHKASPENTRPCSLPVTPLMKHAHLQRNSQPTILLTSRVLASFVQKGQLSIHHGIPRTRKSKHSSRSPSLDSLSQMQPDAFQDRQIHGWCLFLQPFQSIMSTERTGNGNGGNGPDWLCKPAAAFKVPTHRSGWTACPASQPCRLRMWWR